jgi:ssDNA-binding Zn-finger/Zn-ribbon topoisomerase 1
MNEYLPNNHLSNSIVPRSARRSRKPLQDDWIKGPGRGVWVTCTYIKCSFQWQYFGRRRWAECPICHSVVRVAAAKRNFMIQNKANPEIHRSQAIRENQKNRITKMTDST